MEPVGRGCPQTILATAALVSLVLLSFGTTVAKTVNPLSDLTVPFIKLVDTFYNELSKGNQSECQGHAKHLLEANQQAQTWAIQVVDASGHPDSGLLNGGLTYPGLYWECVGTRINFTDSNESTTLLYGQHCLGDITLFGGQQMPPSNVGESLWKAIANNTVSIGLCFPASCSSSQAEYALNSALKESFGEITYNVGVHSCNSQNTSFDLKPGFVIVSILIGLLILLSVIGTVYDVTKEFTSINCCRKQRTNSDVEVTNHPSVETLYRETEANDEGTLLKVLMAFSIRSNGAKILQVGKQEGAIDIFHGLRFLSMLWIIMGHSCSFALTWLTLKNPRQLDQTGTNILSQTLENCTFSVDTFFYLSGFLLIFIAMKHLKKAGSKFNIISAILHRYIRMTPLMMIIIAMTANWLQFAGSGPFWSPAIEMYNSWCQKNWWINALYLQNFIDTGNMCLSHSWYSAVDFQFYIVAVLLIYILNKNYKLGLLCIVVLLAATISTTASITAVYHYPPVPYIGDVIPQEVSNEFSSNVYIKPYCRMGPYLIGMLFGYFLSVNPGGLVLSKKFLVLGWVVAIAVNLTILYSTWPAYLGYLPSNVEASLYGSLARTVWAIGLSWLTFACISGYGGFVNTILSWRALVPLSRLTYCAYLIHPVVMAIFYGSREISFDFSPFLLFYFVLGNLVITYLLAFVLSVLFESPFISLEKIFLKTR